MQKASRMLGTLFAYLEIRCGFAALSRVFLDAQAVDGAGKVCLRGAVFAHAALLEDGLLRLIGGALCTFGIDLFRVLGGVYKHEDIVALDLHHALGNGSGAPLLTRCAVREHARHDGGDHIAMTRQNAVLADRCGHDKRLALALEKDLIGFKQTNFSSKKTPWQLTAIFTFRGV